MFSWANINVTLEANSICALRNVQSCVLRKFCFLLKIQKLVIQGILGSVFKFVGKVLLLVKVLCRLNFS